MANVPESPAWEPGIYQLETTDPVLGGAEGVDNLQAKQLANRTAYLKQSLEALAELIDGVSGGTTNHALLSNRDAAAAHPLAAIDGLVSALAGKAPSEHTHSASSITAGVMAEARLPAASSAARGIVQLVDDLQSLNTDRALTAAQGRSLRLMIEQMSGGGTTDHNALVNRSVSDSHPMSAISGLAEALAGKAAGAHVHSASQITSGVMDAARLPVGSTVVPGIMRLANVLTSTSATEALTAAQGKVLKDLLDGISSATAGASGASGWVKIPAPGIAPIIQWRTQGSVNGSWITWPIAFPTAVLAVVCSEANLADAALITVGTRGATTGGTYVIALNTVTRLPHIGGFTPSLIAIGY
jgi:hypothetical protein